MLHLDMSFDERFALLVEHELIHRQHKAEVRRLHNAKFKLDANLEQIDADGARGLHRHQLAELAQGQWVGQHNLLITGATGSGKTWLACALGKQLCQLQYSVRYVRASRLFDELAIAHGDGSYRKLLQQLAKLDLLILDDFGLEHLTHRQRCDFLEVMDDRHGTKSTAIISQLPVTAWHEIIGEATLADAILDRLIHNAYRFELTGESRRKRTKTGQTS
jgi:DNA replication protein DnaC